MGEGTVRGKWLGDLGEGARRGEGPPLQKSENALAVGKLKM